MSAVASELQSQFQERIDKALKLLDTSPDEVLKAASTLSNQAEDAKDAYAFAWAQYLYGRALSKNSLHKEAIGYLKKAYDRASELDHPLLRANCVVYIGAAYNFLGNFQEASLWHHDAITLCRALEEKALLNVALNNLGVVYGQFGDYAKTLSCFQESLEISRTLDPKAVPLRVLNIGIVYGHLNQHKQAVKYYQEALVQAREFNNRDLESRCLDNLALVELQIEHTETAKDYANAALEISLNTPKLAYRLPFIYRVLGNIYTKVGEYQLGLTNYQQSLSYLQDYPDDYQEVALCHDMGENYILTEAYDSAIDVVEVGLEKATAQGLKPLQYQLHRQLVTAYEAKHDIHMAYKHFKAYHELKEQVQDEDSNDRLHKMTVAAEIERIAKEREFKRIESQLKAEVQQLQIQIDHSKKQAFVEEITSTDYFVNLQKKAKQLRQRNKG